MNPSPKELKQTLVRLRHDIEDLASSLQDSGLSSRTRKEIEADVESLSDRLSEIYSNLDPIHQPISVFNPSSPKTIGRFISIAMIAQEMAPLKGVDQFYGSGIYALYYRGDNHLYQPISGKESPIYVGKADPATSVAESPREQECKLLVRLNDHKKSISSATSTLRIEDFFCRWLVVSSGWESAAELYMINLFKPIWNRETKIVDGFGKHGDSHKTRANKRSPWDTLHPGRKWAMAEALVDSKPPDQIQAEIKNHFVTASIFEDRASILEEFFKELRQSGRS